MLEEVKHRDDIIYALIGVVNFGDATCSKLSMEVRTELGTEELGLILPENKPIAIGAPHIEDTESVLRIKDVLFLQFALELLEVPLPVVPLLRVCLDLLCHIITSVVLRQTVHELVPTFQALVDARQKGPPAIEEVTPVCDGFRMRVLVELSETP